MDNKYNPFLGGSPSLGIDLDAAIGAFKLTVPDGLTIKAAIGAAVIGRAGGQRIMSSSNGRYANSIRRERSGLRES